LLLGDETHDSLGISLSGRIEVNQLERQSTTFGCLGFIQEARINGPRFKIVIAKDGSHGSSSANALRRDCTRKSLARS
jgi:hypothetical protein